MPCFVLSAVAALAGVLTMADPAIVDRPAAMAMDCRHATPSAQPPVTMAPARSTSSNTKAPASAGHDNEIPVGMGWG
jgi:hypothetical protein